MFIELAGLVLNEIIFQSKVWIFMIISLLLHPYTIYCIIWKIFAFGIFCSVLLRVILGIVESGTDVCDNVSYSSSLCDVLYKEAKI